jgi:hypothetical protein
MIEILEKAAYVVPVLMAALLVAVLVIPIGAGLVRFAQGLRKRPGAGPGSGEEECNTKR